MRIMKIFFCSLLFCINLSAFAEAKPTPSNTISIAPMLKKITPAIVNIFVKKSATLPPIFGHDVPRINQPQLKANYLGSGVIFNARAGLIVTNAHVISNAKLIIVTLKNGQRFRAHLVAKTSKLDLAIIQIHAQNLVALPFAQSSTLQVGDFVAAIGSPYGLRQTVTSGVVSALHRTHPRMESIENFIQTDAPINPGNSGGALINLSGKLVGINTAILTSSGGNNGIGFAIPVAMVRATIRQLMQYGHFQRGILGLYAQNLTPRLAKVLGQPANSGVLVTQIIPNGPADQAGIKAGDIILSVNGIALHTANDLADNIALLHPKEQAKIAIKYQNKVSNIMVTIGSSHQLPAQASTDLFRGTVLRDFKEINAKGRLLQGVLVKRIHPGSPAALAGLAAGEIILSINGKPASNLNALLPFIHNPPARLLLNVTKGAGRFFIVINKLT